MYISLANGIHFNTFLRLNPFRVHQHACCPCSMRSVRTGASLRLNTCPQHALHCLPALSNSCPRVFLQGFKIFQPLDVQWYLLVLSTGGFLLDRGRLWTVASSIKLVWVANRLSFSSKTKKMNAVWFVVNAMLHYLKRCANNTGFFSNQPSGRCG